MFSKLCYLERNSAIHLHILMSIKGIQLKDWLQQLECILNVSSAVGCLEREFNQIMNKDCKQGR